MVKLRPAIAGFLVVACASETMPPQVSDVPPHTHQESQSPQGPNTYTLSLARNGASTATDRSTVVRTGF